MNQYFESLIFEPKQRLLRVLLFDETVRASNCVCCNRVTVMQYAKLSRDCGKGTVRELGTGAQGTGVDYTYAASSSVTLPKNQPPVTCV